MAASSAFAGTSLFAPLPHSPFESSRVHLCKSKGADALEREKTAYNILSRSLPQYHSFFSESDNTIEWVPWIFQDVAVSAAHLSMSLLIHVA